MKKTVALFVYDNARAMPTFCIYSLCIEKTLSVMFLCVLYPLQCEKTIQKAKREQLRTKKGCRRCCGVDAPAPGKSHLKWRCEKSFALFVYGIARVVPSLVFPTSGYG
jgi:hypothetical protein